MRTSATLLTALAALGLAGGPVPCEVAVVAARPDAPAPKAEPVDPPLSIAGPNRVDPYRLVRLTAQGGPAGAARLWDVEPLDDPAAAVDVAGAGDGEAFAFVAPPGRYRVELLAVAGGARPAIKRVRLTVTIGPEVAPEPKDDDPKPPAPKPPAPAGFRVIFVREAGAALPAWVQSVPVRQYLDSHCAKGADGRPEWRLFDPDQQFAAKESPTMKAMFEATRPSMGVIPGVSITVAGKGEYHPLPATLAEGLALLRRYGGE